MVFFLVELSKCLSYKPLSELDDHNKLCLATLATIYIVSYYTSIIIKYFRKTSWIDTKEFDVDEVLDNVIRVGNELTLIATRSLFKYLTWPYLTIVSYAYVRFLKHWVNKYETGMINQETSEQGHGFVKYTSLARNNNKAGYKSRLLEKVMRGLRGGVQQNIIDMVKLQKNCSFGKIHIDNDAYRYVLNIPVLLYFYCIFMNIYLYTNIYRCLLYII